MAIVLDGDPAPLKTVHGPHFSAHVEGRAMLRSANYRELIEPRTRGKRYVHAASVLPHHLSGTIYFDTSETMTLVMNNSPAI